MTVHQVGEEEKQYLRRQCLLKSKLGTLKLLQVTNLALSPFNLFDVVNGNPLTDVDVITSPKIVQLLP